ncbi:MAG TPA: gamma carbonic anhydrase family protein [Caldimonas sp.]|jgi:carbonic anhydrase/acetyltransferase-like protein (isoleucine patch superfamily)|nr:gamma carbonic anhydrase family protein [Caldimonas sp.]HEX4233005.1 gamma carbonic anhydrase family protein [Caldimonas sp.]
MPLYRIDDRSPHVAASAYIADAATLVGAVVVGEHASFWPGASARGDNETIAIGAATNIQEGAVLHADPGFPLTIGERVTVGHQAMLHGCTIGDGALIGIQAVVMNGAVIGSNCLVGAGAIVTEGKSFPDRSLIIGAPAKLARALSDEEVAGVERAAAGYVERAANFRARLERID